MMFLVDGFGKGLIGDKISSCLDAGVPAVRFMKLQCRFILIRAGKSICGPCVCWKARGGSLMLKFKTLNCNCSMV